MILYYFLDVLLLFCLSFVIEINVEFCSCRPHPNECSGSDLDGDIYFVSWDPDLIPTRMVAPMDYTPAPTETLDHDVMIEVFYVCSPDYLFFMPFTITSVHLLAVAMNCHLVVLLIVN